MKTFTLVVLVSTTSASVLGQVSQPQLDGIAQKIVVSNNLPYSGQIIVDPAGSMGAAAIRFQGTVARISVHPTMMQTTSANSWAFIIAHEISHQLLGHTGQNGPAQEFQADERGAKLAKKAGFNLRTFIKDMYNKPNNCSRSHGCFHSRAKNLEEKFGIQTGDWNNEHATHGSGSGPFPPVNVQAPWGTFPMSRRIPCRHQIPCQHPFFVNGMWRTAHPFDTLHPFDIVQ